MIFLGIGLQFPKIPAKSTLKPTQSPTSQLFRQINPPILGLILSYCQKAEKLRSTTIVPSTDTRLALGEDSYSSTAFVGINEKSATADPNPPKTLSNDQTSSPNKPYQRHKRLGQTRSALSNTSPASQIPDAALVQILSTACARPNKRLETLLIKRYEQWLQSRQGKPKASFTKSDPPKDALTEADWDEMDDGGVQIAHVLRRVCSRWHTVASFALTKQNKRIAPLLVAAGCVLFRTHLDLLNGGERSDEDKQHIQTITRLFQHFSLSVVSNIFRTLNEHSSIKATPQPIQKPKSSSPSRLRPLALSFSTPTKGPFITSPTSIFLEGSLFDPNQLSPSITPDLESTRFAQYQSDNTSAVIQQSEIGSPGGPDVLLLPNSTNHFPSDSDFAVTFAPAQRQNSHPPLKRSMTETLSRYASTSSLQGLSQNDQSQTKQPPARVLVDHDTNPVPISFGNADTDTSTTIGQTQHNQIMSPSQHRRRSIAALPPTPSKPQLKRQQTDMSAAFGGVGTTASSGELSATVHSQPLCETNLKKTEKEVAGGRGGSEEMPFTTGTILRNGEINPKQITDLRNQWSGGHTSTKGGTGAGKEKGTPKHDAPPRPHISKRPATSSLGTRHSLYATTLTASPPSVHRKFSFQIGNVGEVPLETGQKQMKGKGLTRNQSDLDDPSAKDRTKLRMQIQLSDDSDVDDVIDLTVPERDNKQFGLPDSKEMKEWEDRVFGSNKSAKSIENSESGAFLQLMFPQLCNSLQKGSHMSVTAAPATPNNKTPKRQAKRT
ncbi:hypothetical protein BLNAU_8461 [Blattamonas nauphoetae]|uniref:Uncharacterized protein n=1 Tax=Blattamonas nauphoetae TaxID=2049346 RepID=A0ABQ9XYR8_9EUKA|nr:hypothetical protein BLNAU_8461 [Blattamonas nauphoetae]